MGKAIELAVLGRSNAGKSTLISVLLADIDLGNSLHQNNDKGKTKLNAKYCLYKECDNTTFEIKKNEKLLDYYLKSELNVDEVEEMGVALKKIEKNFADIIPEVKNLHESSLIDLPNNFNEIVKKYIDELSQRKLVEVLALSEQSPHLRDLIELIVVHTQASDIAKRIIDKNKLDYFSIIDTKGFGDATSLIHYEVPKADATIFMISDKYIDSDYKDMESTITDQVKKIPTILCARGQKLRENEINEINESNNVVSFFNENYADAFSEETTPAAKLKKYLKETGIIQTKTNSDKSMMELYLLDDDIFRTLPHILGKNEKTGKTIVTEHMCNNSKDIYCKIVEDILQRAVYAKIKEDESVQGLIEKMTNEKTSTEIRNYILSKCNKYIMQASISPVVNDKDLQRVYFDKTVQSVSKFIETVHRYIHGPQGGTTGHYAYNYDRLAISSYVCLEKCFEELQRDGIPNLDFAQIELIIRKVRRDICRYGKLAGYQEGYTAYIDYDKLCLAYDKESDKAGPWKGNFYAWEYSYENVRNEINNNAIFGVDLGKAQHAASIYYGVINRTVSNAVNGLLSTMPQEIDEFIIK
ncbi:GTPase [Paenibacillus sp. FSL R7-0297]|uniref:GTPase n=1 Tax=unclassified Paenibacillus TaxID=185978 RepID=UPI0004F7B088|nr:GTPase [Paenibacillus sp. FSL R5-0912]AIQ42924.1 hypothetical protein R50912_24970 [Paenibacillus sp. FSL R5-0912]